MPIQSPSDTPLGITIPPASTDELLHALSVTVIQQQATIQLLYGLVQQVYGQVNQMPDDEVWQLHERQFAGSVVGANAGFNASILERRRMLRDVMHQ